MKVHIPNFNTFSTLLDRLSIENVKLAHFENQIEHDSPSADQKVELERKADVQKRIIEALKEEMVTFMRDAFTSGRYEYIREERTFV